MRPQLVCDGASHSREPELTCHSDKPLTDLYDTEGDGGFPGIAFKARPVVGGHFAFLALERACGGEAVAALDFLNIDASQPELLSGDGEL